MKCIWFIGFSKLSNCNEITTQTATAKPSDNSNYSENNSDAADQQQPPAPKHFKLPLRQPLAATSTSDADGLSSGPYNELRNYLADLESHSEDTDALQY